MAFRLLLKAFHLPDDVSDQFEAVASVKVMNAMTKPGVCPGVGTGTIELPAKTSSELEKPK